jgi:hypothetical protein
MSEIVLTGHFWTRGEAGRRAGMSHHELIVHRGVLRLGGHWLDEVYCAFQFNDNGLREDVTAVVEVLDSHFDPATIIDWLVRPHPSLATLSPLHWLDGGRSLDTVLRAARELVKNPPPA